MTKWQTRRELVTKNLPMWRVFRIVDGVEEVDIRLYDTWDDAAKAAWERNAREEAEGRARGRSEVSISVGRRSIRCTASRIWTQTTKSATARTQVRGGGTKPRRWHLWRS